jgi:hypothetical protein
MDQKQKQKQNSKKQREKEVFDYDYYWQFVTKHQPYELILEKFRKKFQKK